MSIYRNLENWKRFPPTQDPISFLEPWKSLSESSLKHFTSYRVSQTSSQSWLLMCIFKERLCIQKKAIFQNILHTVMTNSQTMQLKATKPLTPEHRKNPWSMGQALLCFKLQRGFLKRASEDYPSQLYSYAEVTEPNVLVQKQMSNTSISSAVVKVFLQGRHVTLQGSLNL